MEWAAAIGTFLGENATAIGAAASVAGVGTSIYNLSQKPGGGGKPGPAATPAETAATLSDDERERRRRAMRVSSALTKGFTQPTLGQAALLGA